MRNTLIRLLGGYTTVQYNSAVAEVDSIRKEFEQLQDDVDNITHLPLQIRIAATKRGLLFWKLVNTVARRTVAISTQKFMTVDAIRSSLVGYFGSVLYSNLIDKASYDTARQNADSNRTTYASKQD